MDKLVTDEAINAAMRARWLTGAYMVRQSTSYSSETFLRNQLEAAAPFIAAEAFRRVASNLPIDAFSGTMKAMLYLIADDFTENGNV